MKKSFKKIIFILFVFYCILLAFVLLFPNLHHHSEFERSYNLIPFATISEMIGRLVEQTINADIVIKNIGMNILLFIPLGLALPVLFKKIRRFWKVVLICFAVTVFVETIQYAFNFGSFDIDDIILNTFGGICGYGISIISFMRKSLFD